MAFEMLAASDPRIAFSIGGLEVRWYGIIIVCAMIFGLLYVCSQIKKIGLTADDGVELFLWIIPLAVIFARILYVFPGRIDEYFPWHSFDDFVDTIAIWDGGITIIGGLVGGVLGGIFFTLRHRKQTNFLSVADLVTVPLLTGQIIGRLGNFVNQEAFGLAITDPRFQKFPFGVYITQPSGVSPEFQAEVNANVPGWFCATFFYEMVWNFIGLALCFSFWMKGKNKKFPGLMIIFYFFWYFAGRLWLEYLRMDAVPVTKVACAIVAPLALVLGSLYVVYRISRMSYDRVSKLHSDGRLAGAALTEFDVKNYKFVVKIYAKKRVKVGGKDVSLTNPLKLLYGKNIPEEIDFECVDYYHVPKGYRRRFNNFAKTYAYAREA